MIDVENLIQISFGGSQTRKTILGAGRIVQLTSDLFLNIFKHLFVFFPFMEYL